MIFPLRLAADSPMPAPGSGQVDVEEITAYKKTLIEFLSRQDILKKSGIYSKSGKLYFDLASMTAICDERIATSGDSLVRIGSFPNSVFNTSNGIGGKKGVLTRAEHLKDLCIKLGIEVASEEEEKAAHREALKEFLYRPDILEKSGICVKDGKLFFGFAELAAIHTELITLANGQTIYIPSFPSSTFNKKHSIGSHYGNLNNPNHLRALCIHLGLPVADEAEDLALYKADQKTRLEQYLEHADVLKKSGIYKTNEGKFCFSLASLAPIIAGSITLRGGKTMHLGCFPSAVFNKQHGIGSSNGTLRNTTDLRKLSQVLGLTVASDTEEKETYKAALVEFLQRPDILKKSGTYIKDGKFYFNFSSMGQIANENIIRVNGQPVQLHCYPSVKFNKQYGVGGSVGSITNPEHLRKLCVVLGISAATEAEEILEHRVVLEKFLKSPDVLKRSGIYIREDKLYFNQAALAPISSEKIDLLNGRTIMMSCFPSVTFNREHGVNAKSGVLTHIEHLKKLCMVLGIAIATNEEEFLDSVYESRKFQSDQIETQVQTGIERMNNRLRNHTAAIMQVYNERAKQSEVRDLVIVPLTRSRGYDISYYDTKLAKRVYLDVIYSGDVTRDDYTVSAAKVNKCREILLRNDSEYAFCIISPEAKAQIISGANAKFTESKAFYRAKQEVEAKELLLEEKQSKQLEIVYNRIKTILDREELDTDKDSEVNWDEVFKELAGTDFFATTGIRDEDKPAIVELFKLYERSSEIKHPEVRQEAESLLKEAGLLGREVDLGNSKAVAALISKTIDKWLASSKLEKLTEFLREQSILSSHLNYSDLLRIEEYKIRLGAQAKEDLAKQGVDLRNTIVRATLSDREDFQLSASELKPGVRVIKVFAELVDGGLRLRYKTYRQDQMKKLDVSKFKLEKAYVAENPIEAMDLAA